MNAEHGTIVFYKNQAGFELAVKLKEDSVWLSLNQMAELFGRDKSVISRHIKNIFKMEELEQAATVANFATAQKEGDREITRITEYFNLDMIIAVGYRVNSRQGTQFRQRATRVLKDHLLQGFTYHEKRLQEKGLDARKFAGKHPTNFCWRPFVSLY